MARVKLADFQLFDDRCVNGCCASRRMRSGCLLNSTDLIGPKESNYFSAIGLDAVKERKSILSLQIVGCGERRARSEFSQHAPTRYTAPLIWYWRPSFHWSISSLPRNNGLRFENIVSAPRARVTWSGRILPRKKPVSSPAPTRSIL